MQHTLRAPLLRAVLAALITAGTLAALASPAGAARTTSGGDGQAPAGVGPHTWTIEDVRITATNGPEDGETVELDASIWKPDDASAAEPMPAMLIAPGFGNTKTAPEMVALAAYFASHGYVAMTFTPQGFGASTGCIGLDSRTYDGKNAITMIDHLAALDYVEEEAPGDPRIGMVGGSYGGGLQGHTAIADPRLDAISPGRTWLDLQYSLDPNNWVQDDDEPYAVTGYEQGVFKQGWTSLFFAAGSAQPAQGNGGCDPVTRATRYPTATPCTSWIPGICETYARVSTTGDVNEDDRALIADSSTGPELAELDVPTLLPQGLPDTLFNVNETVPWLLDLQARGVPVSVIWHSSGHGGHDPAPGDGEPYSGKFDDSPERQAEFAQAYLPRRILAWMERHVRGDASVDTGPAFAYFRDWVDYDVAATGGTAAPAYGTAPTVPPVSFAFTLDPTDGELVAQGDPIDGGEASFLNPVGGEPAAYSEIPNFSSPGDPGDRPATDIEGQHVAFETAPLEAPMDVVGVPLLDLQLSHENALRDARVFVKLYDVAADGTATLVHRQVAPSRVPTDALGDVATRLRLIGLSHRFDAGHRVRLVVAATDQAYYNERAPDVLTVSSTGDAPSVLHLPVVGGAPGGGAPPPRPRPPRPSRTTPPADRRDPGDRARSRPPAAARRSPGSRSSRLPSSGAGPRSLAVHDDGATVAAKGRFELGRTYTAAEITAVVGGQESQSFPVEGRRTVAIRVGRRSSPDAPARVYVGNRPREIRAARNLVSEGAPVPVFVRDDPTSDFAYVGSHRAQGFDESPGAAEGATNAVGRPMAGILHLEPAG